MTTPAGLILQDLSDYGWLDDEETPLGGFAWRGGAERETTGILMWSEPYFMRTPTNEEVQLYRLSTVKCVPLHFARASSFCIILLVAG